jgi:chromosome segregation ATPase
MGTFMTLFRRKSTPDGTLEELKVLLAKSEEDKAALESLVSSATEASAALRSQVEALNQPDNPITDLRKQADVIRGEFAGYVSDIAAARKDLGALRQAQEDVLSRFGEARKQLVSLKDEIDGAASRVIKLENSLEMLSAAEETAARTEQHIKALNTLSDYVTQKVMSLEKQREVVDRAAAQGARLHELVWELDARLNKQQEESRALKRAQASVEELKALHKDVEKRTAEARATHDRVHRETEAIQTNLLEMREEIRHGMERFELDKGGLEAVSQRIGDLRSLLVEAESRFQALEQSNQQMADARAQADNLSARLAAVTGEVAAVEDQMEGVQTVRQNVDRARQSADELSARIARLEATHPMLQEVLSEVEGLRGAREELRDALEQMRGARGEVERIQSSQMETLQTLAKGETTIAELSARLANLEAGYPVVERPQETANLGRTRETEKLEVTVTNVAQSVAEIERRMADINTKMAGTQQRADELQVLSERIDQVGRDVEGRYQALEKTKQHLERVSALRRDASEVVEAIEGQQRQLTSALAAAEEHSAKVSQIAEQLEGRAGHLRFADKRMTRFEEKLAELERLEQEVLRSIEALGSRQASVKSVHKDLKQLFDVAEQTREGVRSITAARDEVQAARAKAEEVLAAAKGVMAVGELIEEREHQLQAAEVRLARAEGVLMDTQASLETLRSQKALIDHVVEKAGKLEFQAKEAEALIASLREERELAAKIHEAVVELRNESGKKAG